MDFFENSSHSNLFKSSSANNKPSKDLKLEQSPADYSQTSFPNSGNNYRVSTFTYKTSLASNYIKSEFEPPLRNKTQSWDCNYPFTRPFIPKSIQQYLGIQCEISERSDGNKNALKINEEKNCSTLNCSFTTEQKFSDAFADLTENNRKIFSTEAELANQKALNNNTLYSVEKNDSVATISNSGQNFTTNYNAELQNKSNLPGLQNFLDLIVDESSSNSEFNATGSAPGKRRATTNYSLNLVEKERVGGAKINLQHFQYQLSSSSVSNNSPQNSVTLPQNRFDFNQIKNSEVIKNQITNHEHKKFGHAATFKVLSRKSREIRELETPNLAESSLDLFEPSLRFRQFSNTSSSSFSQYSTEFKNSAQLSRTNFSTPQLRSNYKQEEKLSSSFLPVEINNQGAALPANNHTSSHPDINFPRQPIFKKHFVNYITEDCLTCLSDHCTQNLVNPNYNQNKLLTMANSTTMNDDNTTAMDANRELQMKILAFEQIFSSIVGLLGLLGAILVILVYNYRHKATLSEKIITALSVIDFCYNFFAMIILTSGKYLVTDREGTAYLILRSVNYFLFGFAVISSFLLIQLITINRFYAICRPTEYKTTFNKRRVRMILIIIFAVALFQGSTNASYAFVDEGIITTIIDMEYIGMLDLNVSAASALMCLVYVKVLLKFAKQRKRLNSHAKMSSPNEYQERIRKANAPQEPTDIDRVSSGTNLLSLPTSANTINTLNNNNMNNNNNNNNQATSNNSSAPESPQISAANKIPASSKLSLGNGKKSVSSLFTKNMSEKRRRANSSDRVTFTLFIISIVFMFCVCPFVVDYNYKTFSNEQDYNVYLSLIIRMLFQINFLSNPVIYFSTSKIFRGRTFEIIGYFSPRMEKYLRNSSLFRNCLPPEEAVAKTNMAGRSYAMTEKTTF